MSAPAPAANRRTEVHEFGETVWEDTVLPDGQTVTRLVSTTVPDMDCRWYSPDGAGREITTLGIHRTRELQKEGT